MLLSSCAIEDTQVAPGRLSSWLRIICQVKFFVFQVHWFSVQCSFYLVLPPDGKVRDINMYRRELGEQHIQFKGKWASVFIHIYKSASWQCILEENMDEKITESLIYSPPACLHGPKKYISNQIDGSIGLKSLQVNRSNWKKILWCRDEIIILTETKLSM